MRSLTVGHSSSPSSSPVVVEPVQPLEIEVHSDGPAGWYRRWRLVVASRPVSAQTLPIREWKLPVSFAEVVVRRRFAAVVVDIPWSDKLKVTLVVRDDVIQHRERDMVHHSKSDYPVACGGGVVVDLQDPLRRKFHPKSD